MSIDWITVSAQILNFLLLVWLLKHFLYQRVIDAMDRRESRITERLSEARERERQAREQQQQYEDKQHELEQQRDSLVDAANKEADEEKQRKLDEARDEVEKTRANWQQQVEQEQTEFLERLRRETVTTIQAIARKAIGDLADSTLEEQMINVCIQHLDALEKSDRKALAGGTDPIEISSAEELESSARSRLTRAIHKHLGQDVDVQYLQSGELLCGIEIKKGGRKLGWNLADYLDQLDQRIQDAFARTRITKD